MRGADQVWHWPPCLPADSSTGFPLPALHWAWPALLLPWDQVNKLGAEELWLWHTEESCFCLHAQAAAAVLRDPGDQLPTCPAGWALQWDSVQEDSQGSLLLSFLYSGKQIITEAKNFMLNLLKDNESEPLRPQNYFSVGLQGLFPCKNHKVLGLEKIINHPSQWFFIQFGKETFE